MKLYKIKVCGVWSENLYMRYKSEYTGSGYATQDLFTFVRDGMVQDVQEIK